MYWLLTGVIVGAAVIVYAWRHRRPGVESVTPRWLNENAYRSGRDHRHI